MKRWMRQGAAVVLAAFLALESPMGAVSSLADEEVFTGRKEAVSDEKEDSFLLSYQGMRENGGGSGLATPSDGEHRLPDEAYGDEIHEDSEKEAEKDEPLPKRRETQATPSDAEIKKLLAMEEIGGSLKIELRGAAPGRASRWKAELIPEDRGEEHDARGREYESLISLPAVKDKEVQASASIDGILPGTYLLRLTPEQEGNSYLPYEQNITIGMNQIAICLINGDPLQYGYKKEDAAKLGVLVMGDVNGDEKLDETDMKELLNLTAKGMAQGGSVYERADLNGDRVVNLLDVDVFTGYYYKKDLLEQKAAPVTTVRVRKDEIVAAPSNATMDKGSASVTEVFAGTNESALGLKAEEAISEETPLEITAEFTGGAKVMGGLEIDPVPGSGGSIQDGEIVVEDENGTEHRFSIVDGKVSETAQKESRKEKAVNYDRIIMDNEMFRPGQIYARSSMTRKLALTAAEEPEQTMDRGVPIVIDLGAQVAVKKITIRVTKTIQSLDLVEISKVEFYENMEDRIPEPEMSAPERVTVENHSKSFTVSWKNVPNVTGYRVEVTGPADGKGTVTAVFSPEINECEVTGLNGGDLLNGETYEVSIRSVNGSWRSDAAEVTAEPNADSLPPAPEDLVITPGGQSLKIVWKKMKDTDQYTLYYKETEGTAAGFTSVSDIKGNAYTIERLKEDTEYEIYLTGTNGIGTGPESLHYKVRTSAMKPPVTPNYKLINVAEEGKEATAHIVSVEQGSGTSSGQFDAADGKYDTYWVLNDWDAGYYYTNQAPKVTFDNVYEMNTMVLVPDEVQPYSLGAGKINYWDEKGEKKTVEARMTRKTSNGKYYYMFHTLEPIRAKSVQLAVYTYGSGPRVGIAELKFYHYDPIEKEIMDLYGDTFHVSLRTEPQVTQETIDDLRARLQVPDEASGELHPRKAELEKELDNAEKILRDGNADGGIIQIDNKDTVKADSHITFLGGLNTFQPLGVTALAGETVTIYVGGPNHRDGDNTRLELYMAQYHGSSAAVFKSMGYLKAGANEIAIEALDQMDKERGGQLYVEYTGQPGQEEYGVRVSGGHRSAFLDISDVTGHSSKVALAERYLEELMAQNEQCQTLHEQDHASYSWEPENCIYQATDIVTRYNMVSSAAKQVLAGLEDAAGSSSVGDMAEQLVNSMDALDEMMVLFYHHKGLSEAEDTPAHNRMPVSRINIRYQRMFAGAFMYAGGRHIGIEWPELKGLMGGHPVTADEDGRYQSGGYFGWGIAHEVGHEINEGAYAVAEVTNNYFSVLAQARDNNDSVRFKYEDVYNKVTSGTKGKASNVFVQLAMYWQLHLAYDLGGYNYKIYDTNEQQLENLIFARMDSYARKPDTAPGAGDNKLSLAGADTDNKLMRLASAAAQKNILEFFRRWGLEPDEGTIRYASQFEEETRGIWFANDDTRVRQLENGGKNGYANQAASAAVTGHIASVENNRVTLNLSSDDSIWMYEIYRYERVKNQIVRRPAGYVKADGGPVEFTDVIGTVNNRTFTYEAVGYDMWLNPTARAEIGTAKVSHDGSIDKKLWTVETNLTNGDYVKPDKDNPDTGEQPGLGNMVDNNNETSFTGKTEDGTDPEIILNLNQEETITGISYIAGTDQEPADGFEVYVSSTGRGDWVKAKTAGEPVTDGERKVIHFNDGTNLFTYDASYVRLTAKGMAGRELCIAELSLLGQTGDNVELAEEGGIGVLDSNYTGSDGSVEIPEGSLVFTGTYKGNPAYNTVLLWDENGQIVGGTDQDGSITAQQIIFAPVPDGNGTLGEVSDGIWVYFITPDHKDSVKPKKVRAELYRTDDARTNAGERLVSSTEFVDVPEVLPTITLKQGGVTP